MTYLNFYDLLANSNNRLETIEEILKLLGYSEEKIYALLNIRLNSEQSFKSIIDELESLKNISFELDNDETSFIQYFFDDLIWEVIVDAQQEWLSQERIKRYFDANQLIIAMDAFSAPHEEIADVLADLSILYRMMGGSGINFEIADVNVFVTIK